MKIRTFALVLALASAGPASATLIASESFAYSTGALTAANGGTGWGGAWSTTPVVSVVDPATDLDGDRALRLGGNRDNAASRTLASAFTGDSIYVSIMLQVQPGSTINRNDFLGVWLTDGAANGGAARPALGIKGNEDTAVGTDDIFGRTATNGGQFADGSDLVTDATYLIVGHLYRSAPGNYTNFDLWLDPVLGDLGTPDLMTSGDSGISQITRLGIRTANLDTGDAVLLDRLLLTTSFNQAIGVPEPGVLGLLGISLAGLAFMRRRMS